MTPYFDDGQVTLYCGDMREVLPALGPDVGVTIADPPYGETSLTWDRWPPGWVDAVHDNTPDRSTLWCFGSMRMFLDRRDDFDDWTLAQDIVWEKHNGSSMAVDRFRRVHEMVTHWYRCPWSEVFHDTPTSDATPEQIARNGTAVRTTQPVHWGSVADRRRWSETGKRVTRSVLKVTSTHGHAIHPTQKPLGIIDPLLRYSLPPGGTVLDPFAGSCSTLVAAREAGYRAIGIEASEEMCAKAAERLAQGVLFGATP
jgi:site-specific DNA-methyltransferase (adenine-specific)